MEDGSIESLSNQDIGVSERADAHLARAKRILRLGI